MTNSQTNSKLKHREIFFAFLVMRVRSRVGRGFALRNMFCLG